MGWERSNRASRLPRDWKARRDAVRRRAGGICEWIDLDTGRRCPLAGRDCDHVIRGDDHRLSNLQWLCVEHHRAKTAAEAADARPSEKRQPGKHPGLR